MNRDEFIELVYETFADEPDNVLANGIIEAADAYVEYEKAQHSQTAQHECESDEWIIASVAGMPAIHHEKCGVFVYAPQGKTGFNYCPNCGAKMEAD